jgi:uncharacterized protein YxjI
MAIPPPPDGWSRFLVKSKFGAGRDFQVLDPVTEESRYFVDGAMMSMKPKAAVKAGDADGAVLYRITGQLLGIPKRMVITTEDGTEAAELRGKAFSMIKEKISLQIPGEDPWSLEGSFIEKNYRVDRAGQHIVQITQKWVTVRDAYVLDVAEGVDVGLALAIVWAVDRWTERD